jgi:L-malate glycosyltransferase
VGDTTDGQPRPASARPDVLLVGDGKNVHVRRLAAALAEGGLAVELACFEGDPIPGVVLHRLGRRPPAQDRRYPLAIPALARLVRRRRPRVVHACFLSSYGLMTALALLLVRAVGRRPRIVQSALGSDLLVKARTSRIRALLAQLTLRTADVVT